MASLVFGGDNISEPAISVTVYQTESIPPPFTSQSSLTGCFEILFATWSQRCRLIDFFPLLPAICRQPVSRENDRRTERLGDNPRRQVNSEVEIGDGPLFFHVSNDFVTVDDIYCSGRVHLLVGATAFQEDAGCEAGLREEEVVEGISCDQAMFDDRKEFSE